MSNWKIEIDFEFPYPRKSKFKKINNPDCKFPDIFSEYKDFSYRNPLLDRNDRYLNIDLINNKNLLIKSFLEKIISIRQKYGYSFSAPLSSEFFYLIIEHIDAFDQTDQIKFNIISELKDSLLLLEKKKRERIHKGVLFMKLYHYCNSNNYLERKYNYLHQAYEEDKILEDEQTKHYELFSFKKENQAAWEKIFLKENGDNLKQDIIHKLKKFDKTILHDENSFSFKKFSNKFLHNKRVRKEVIYYMFIHEKISDFLAFSCNNPVKNDFAKIWILEIIFNFLRLIETTLSKLSYKGNDLSQKIGNFKSQSSLNERTVSSYDDKTITNFIKLNCNFQNLSSSEDQVKLLEKLVNFTIKKNSKDVRPLEKEIHILRILPKLRNFLGHEFPFLEKLNLEIIKSLIDFTFISFYFFIYYY